MKTNNPARACGSKQEEENRPRAALAAVALMLAALPLAVPVAAGAPIVAGSCVAYDDDPGFGGSDVTCTLGCGKNAELLVAGYAQDPDAAVSAAYNCGGQGAGCTSPTPFCADASPGLTSSAQDDASCSAESNEFWSSTVYVACAVTVGMTGDNKDPEDLLCDIVNDTFPPCKGIEKIRALCLTAAPRLTVEDGATLDRLFPVAFGDRPIAHLVSVWVREDRSLSVVEFHDGAAPSCAYTTA